MHPVSCRILLIENNEDDVFLFERALRNMGCPGPVVHVESPAAATQYLRDHPGEIPDLVVCDGMFHGHGAAEFLRWLRGNPTYCHLPFIVHTGDNTQARHDEMMELGATAVFVKAIDFRETVKMLRAVIRALPEHCRQWLH